MAESRILYLELQDFKSYRGHVKVGPFKDFTCIVGPNGAGKSNLLDALSVVLSPSASSIRGSRLNEFINRESKARHWAVSVVIGMQESSASHSVSFSNTEEGEGGAAGLACSITLTRCVDEKDVSTFEVDGKGVTMAIYTETLAQYNIGARIRNFVVFQHEVEELRQKKPKELTELIEEVSGSAALKSEYEEKKKELTNANEALAKASSEKRSATMETNQMRLIAKDVEHFHVVQQEHKNEQRRLALAELFYVESALYQQKEGLIQFHGTLDKLQQGIPTEAQIRLMKQNYVNQHKTYVDELKESRSITETYRSTLSSLERAKASLGYMKHQHSIEKERLAGLLKNVTSRSAELKRLHVEKSRYESMLQELDGEGERDTQRTMASMSHLSNEDYKEYQGLKQECESLTVTKREQRETLEQQLQLVNAALDQSRAEKESLEMHRKEFSENMSRLQVQHTELLKRREDLISTVKNLEAEIAQANKAQGLSKKRHSEREATLFKVQEQLRELRHVRDTDKQNHRILEVIEALKSIFPLRGRLVDLCSIPDNSYRVSITVALGKNLEAVVVDTTETAIACIRYLKEHRLPSLTFLPLNAVSGKEVSDRLRTFGGSCKPVVDVLDYNPELENAIRYALGESLVCDTLQEARHIAFGNSDGKRYKVITREGTVLMKNGAIQGGLASVEGRAKKWDDRKYEELRATRDKLLQEAMREGEADLAKAHLTIRDMASRLDFSRERQKVVDQELEVNHEKRNRIAQQEERILMEEKGLDVKHKMYEKEKDELLHSIGKLNEEIKAIEGRIFSKLQARVSISELIDLERKESELAQERGRRRQQMLVVIHKLQSAIELEEKRCGDDKASQEIKAACERKAMEIKNLEEQIRQWKTECEALNMSSSSVRKRLNSLRDTLDKLQEKIRQASHSSETELHRLALARKGGAGLEAACESLRQRRVSIIQRCQMEGIELPVRGASHPIASDAIAARKRSRTEEEKRSFTTGPSIGLSNDSSRNDMEPDHSSSAAQSGLGVESEPFSLPEESSLPESGRESSTTHSSTSSTSSPSLREDLNRSACGELIVIDFSELPAAHRQVISSREGIEAFRRDSKGLIEKLEAEMDNLAPRIKAASRLTLVEGRIEECTTFVETARERFRKANAAFQEVRFRRTRQFRETFEKLAAQVDRIYKELTFGTRQHGAPGSAYLSLEDAEEPYAGGTAYHVTPPLKRFMPMELLSGGERTMAALALLFSIHAVCPVPFFILDEVDAALDAANVDKLSRFLRKHADQCQFLIVSHKDLLYGYADILVGVTKGEKNVSRVISLDLRGYP